MPTIEANISEEAKTILDMAVEKTRFNSYGEIIDAALGVSDKGDDEIFQRGGEGTSAFRRSGDRSDIFK